MQIEFFSFGVTFIIGFYGNTLRWEIYEWLFRFFMEKYEPPLGCVWEVTGMDDRRPTYCKPQRYEDGIEIYLCNYLFTYFNIIITQMYNDPGYLY